MKFVYLNYSLIKKTISFIIEIYPFIEKISFFNIKNENYTLIIKIKNKIFIISKFFFASIIKNKNEIFIISKIPFANIIKNDIKIFRFAHIIKLKYETSINKKKKIVKLFADFIREVDTKYAFHNYYYAITELKLLFDKKIKTKCFNTKCFVTLINHI